MAISIPLKLKSIYICPVIILTHPQKIQLICSATISIHVQSINVQICFVTIIEQQQHGKLLCLVAIYSLKSLYTHFIPSGNINTVPVKANLYAQWISSGYINTVPRNMNPYTQWLSQHMRPVAILI